MCKVNKVILRYKKWGKQYRYEHILQRTSLHVRGSIVFFQLEKCKELDSVGNIPVSAGAMHTLDVDTQETILMLFC